MLAEPIHLRPLKSDLLIARACARMASPKIERPLNFLTSAADERAMLGIAAAVWLAARYCKRTEDRGEADIMLASVLVAGVMPDLFKLLVRRRRPDRALKGRRNGIPYSGNAWDSFPSGHAIHVGAIAPSVARLVPRSFRQSVWPTLFCLAATRTLILAHYPSDVAAGLVIGLATNKTVRAALARWRFSRTAKELQNAQHRTDALGARANRKIRKRVSRRGQKRNHLHTMVKAGREMVS